MKTESTVNSTEVKNFDCEREQVKVNNAEISFKCGEIFLKNNDNLLIACTHCTSSFEIFEKFLDHIKMIRPAVPNYKEDQHKITVPDNLTQTETLNFYKENGQTTYPAYQHFQQHQYSVPSYTCPNENISTTYPPSQNYGTNMFKDCYNNISEFPQSIGSSSQPNESSSQPIGSSSQPIDSSSQHSQPSVDYHKTNDTVDYNISHQKKYKCEHCQKSFNQSQNLRVHLRIHTGERPYSCDVCQKSFSHKSNLNVHKRVHNNILETKTDEHGSVKNSNVIQNQVKCENFETSGIELNQNHQLGFYRDINIKYEATSSSSINTSQMKYSPYRCEFCQKTFSQSQNLVVHKRIHTGEKPYSCEFCEKSFSHKSNLNVHKRTHTGIKPYNCDLCDKNFSDKSALICHKKLHSGDKPFKCRLCERAFSTRTELKQHTNTHTGEKPHQCDICLKSFANNSNLIIHRRIHTGEKPYTCDICLKTFRHNSNLVVHKKTHTSWNPHRPESYQQ